MNPAFWRKWHRWIGWPASIFLLFASITGVLVAITEKFGPEEEEREHMRTEVSPITLNTPVDSWVAALNTALAAARDSAGAAPLDKIEVQFKGDEPTIKLFTGKPTGGEDKKFVMDERTGRLLQIEKYEDKPFLHRLHSGEAIGDGGLILAMVWGTALAIMTVTGLTIYLRMRRPGAVGIKKYFW